MTNQIINSSKYIAKDFEAYTDKKRIEMITYIPEEAKNIIDVGCAIGTFGKSLKDIRKVNVLGIEINEYAANQAKLHLDNVICGAFQEDLALPHKQFDCIVFNDVLEHMVDPFEALLYAKKLLNQKGVIVASIPNVRYFNNIWNLLINKDWKYEKFGILDRTHLRFFTKKSIVKTFENLGYQISTIEGINLLEDEHPYQRKKFKILNTIFLNHLEDMNYLQFAIVAHPNI